MTWWFFHWSTGWEKTTGDLLPGTDILLGGNPSMMARLRLREDILSAGCCCCHAKICWRKLEFLWRFFLGFQDIYLYIYIYCYCFTNFAARTINFWALQRLLRLWKNRSSTASSFRENPGLLGQLKITGEWWGGWSILKCSTWDVNHRNLQKR